MSCFCATLIYIYEYYKLANITQLVNFYVMSVKS